MNRAATPATVGGGVHTTVFPVAIPGGQVVDRRDPEREVPRCDHGIHAAGSTLHQDALARIADRDRFRSQRYNLVGSITEGCDHRVDLAMCLGMQRLSVLSGQLPGQIVLVSRDCIGKAPAQICSFEDRSPAMSRRRLSSGGDSKINIVGGPEHDMADVGSCSGAAELARGAVGAMGDAIDAHRKGAGCHAISLFLGGMSGR